MSQEQQRDTQTDETTTQHNGDSTVTPAENPSQRTAPPSNPETDPRRVEHAEEDRERAVLG